MIRTPGRYWNLTLGEYYDISFNGFITCKRVKLIRTSPKGFNFLNEKTSKCIYPTARCAKGFGGIPHPKDLKEFTIFFPKVTTNIKLSQ